jgi:hypothetical protein
LLSQQTQTIRADVIVGAVSASSPNGWSNTGASWDTAHLISQVGLSSNYVSGVTDASTFTATHNDANDEWVSETVSGLPATVTFDLGSMVSIDGFLYWQGSWYGHGGYLSVQEFDLFADSDDDIGNGFGTLLGSFSPGANDVRPHPVERFNFADTTTQFVHMRINDDFGSDTRAGFSEAAFISGTESSPVPEPSSLALLGMGGLTLLGYGRRRSRKRLPHPSNLEQTS